MAKRDGKRIERISHLKWTLNVFEEPLMIKNGWVRVLRRPGIGTTLRTDIIERYRPQ
jgi:L-alanine-DL-glutamate epimerase-like enolase superfamily enzyme